MEYYIGLDLGGTFIKGGVVAHDGVVLVKDKIPTGKERLFEEVAADMADFAARLALKAGVKVSGVGVCSPGLVDSKNGVIVYANNLGWNNACLGKYISSALGVPAYAANDANAAALGEQKFGAGSNYSDVVFVTLGTGVGGGIVIDGKLFEGHKSAGAEIGHAVIRMGGEKCTCGRRGCFEAYASATALIRQTQKAMLKNSDSILWKLCGGDINKVEGKTAFDGLKEGDRTAKRVINNYINYLSEGIANLCNEFHPQAILIGGGVSAAGDALINPLKQKVQKLVYGNMDYAPIDILAASLGNDAGLYGAACLAMNK